MFVYTRVHTHTSLSKSTYTQSIFSFKCRRLSYSRPSVRDPLIGPCPLTHFIYLFLYIPFPLAPLLPTDHIPNVFDEYPHVCMCSFNIYTSISFAYLLRKWNRAINFRYRVLRFFWDAAVHTPSPVFRISRPDGFLLPATTDNAVRDILMTP